MEDRMIKRISFCVFGFLLLSGCASTSFKPKIELNDPLAFTANAEKRADKMSWGDADDITVFSGSLPKGVVVDPNKVNFGDSATTQNEQSVSISNSHLPRGIVISGGKAIISPAFPYEILGEVHTETNGEFAIGIANAHGVPLYFYPYSEDEGWKNPFCHIQVPLAWVTLAIWTLVPTYWPCRTLDSNGADDVDARKMRIVNTLKKATKAMGGTHLLFVGEYPLVLQTTQGVAYNFGRVTTFSSSTETERLDWAQGWGLVLKKKNTESQK
jgi:hypothetical protein